MTIRFSRNPVFFLDNGCEQHRLDTAMDIIRLMHHFNLNQMVSTDSESDKTVLRTKEGFFASVEKRADVIALAACHDQHTALDVVQDAMLSMVKNYASKLAEQWTPLFFKVFNNRITDQHRKRGFGRIGTLAIKR